MRLLVLGPLLLSAAMALAEDQSLQAHLALLGDSVTLERTQPLTIHEPARWIGHREGHYRYRYVAGSDHGDLEQVRRDIPDPQRPAQAWTRHIGEALIEQVEVVDGQAIRIYTETDSEHGYRVVMRPGVTFPAGLQAGDRWQSDNQLEVYRLGEDDKPSYTGHMSANHQYLGTWRIRVPAGDFQAVLIRDRYKLQAGPFKAEDERYAFYVRDLGLVAEVEGLRASALIVFRLQEESAKVLVDYPEASSP